MELRHVVLNEGAHVSRDLVLDVEVIDDRGNGCRVESVVVARHHANVVSRDIDIVDVDFRDVKVKQPALIDEETRDKLKVQCELDCELVVGHAIVLAHDLEVDIHWGSFA